MARDVGFVASDLGCALLQVSVSGLSRVVSWVGVRRQLAAVERWERENRYEAALRAAEEAVECLEPCKPSLDSLLRAYWDAQTPEVEDQAVNDLVRFYPEGEWTERAWTKPFVHPVDARHHGGHQLHLDGTLTPIFSVDSSPAQHPSAGRVGDGPEDVSASSGQPTAGELLDHIEALIHEHVLTREGGWWVCCRGCDWWGPDSEAHADHVFDAVRSMVAADRRVNNTLKDKA